MRHVLALAAVMAAIALPSAQTTKKVFISADMEGISGISASDQLSATGAEYNRSRRMMADDVNAAIRGARRGGARDIVVNDSHGSMRNLRLEDQVAEVARTAKTVAVKRAINPRAVELRPFKEVHHEIEEAAYAGVRDAAKFAPERAAAYKVEVQFEAVTIPEVAASIPTMERPAPDTIAFTADSMPKAYTLIRLLYRYINPD